MTRLVSVIIPAHDEAATIGDVIRAVRAQARGDRSVEVIVADDGSTDDTVAVATAAGAKVVGFDRAGAGGNPAAARNAGAAVAAGDPLVFLDADCTPSPEWLDALLEAHARGAVIVGGALDLPDGLPASARCDYYCGWYLVHSRRPAGWVPHHPPPNLSVRADAFRRTRGFMEEQPFSYTNEERAWQAELREGGHGIWFEPRAMVYHHNRPGFANLLRRNYRWAYTSLESKSRFGTARMAWLYRYPRTMIALSLPLAFAHTAFIAACWARARRIEPLLMLPAILISRFAYSAGLAVGGVRWLRRRGRRLPAPAPRWR
jgi:glycosyltransferase involved in cell wall biosynthesis